ncbi:MAG: twin-arginine translocase TatA/TatE family subunit [Synergistaceae bacterium]|nr:twin-arginine translocase TatA/TatE family subunit [Synergistaceae bacterium]
MILLIAFVVVGPKDLPKVARWLARLVRRFRSLAKEVRAELQLDDLERELSTTEGSINQELGRLKSDLSLEDSTAEIREGIAQLDSSIKSQEE